MIDFSESRLSAVSMSDEARCQYSNTVALERDGILQKVGFSICVTEDDVKSGVACSSGFPVPTGALLLSLIYA